MRCLKGCTFRRLTGTRAREHNHPELGPVGIERRGSATAREPPTEPARSHDQPADGAALPHRHAKRPELGVRRARTLHLVPGQPNQIMPAADHQRNVAVRGAVRDDRTRAAPVQSLQATRS